MSTYLDFLRRKTWTTVATGFAAGVLPAGLFPFQADLVRWACRRGRAALFVDTGLGKTAMQLAWAQQVIDHTGGSVLILAPLAVAAQTVREATKFGMVATLCRNGADATAGINVTNYDRLHRFDPEAFGGVVLDESSCLKDFTSATRTTLIDSFRATPHKLCCTATPAPNDFTELGNHAEFLGVMTRSEMLAMYFVHDGGSTQDWRVKGHAEGIFWQWVCSWAACVRKPSELGYDDGGFALPPLVMTEIVVPATEAQARAQGRLFVDLATTLAEQRAARRASTGARVAVCAEAVAREPDKQWLIWCELNAEGDALTAAIPGAVQVAGADALEDKEQRILDFAEGRTRVLVSKPSICGHGVNLQRCSRVAFVGVSHSFEQFYQAVRRCWRFGQTEPVHCYLVLGEAEGPVRDNLRRKQADAERMTDAMTAYTAQLVRAQVRGLTRDVTTYRAETEMQLPKWIDGARAETNVIDQAAGDGWALWQADSVDALRGIPESSVGLSVYSPPFASLYTYSNSDRDMGNCRTHAEFHEHFGWLMPEMLRVTKPGRNMCVHCMDLPTSKVRDGHIGLQDFPGELIRAAERAGWIWHSKVTIWKDPVTQMQRTKALGLLGKQLWKDSAMSRMGLADYVLTFRRPGENAEPISHSRDEFPVSQWQQWASPIWIDIQPNDTLQYRSAREAEDERHICPLQLEVIRRCVRLWSNPGDVVLSPFAGIGSEGYVAIQERRRHLGIELKASYYQQAAKNLASAEPMAKGAQTELFA